MNSSTSNRLATKPHRPFTQDAPFPLSPIAAIVAGMTLWATGTLHAAEVAPTLLAQAVGQQASPEGQAAKPEAPGTEEPRALDEVVVRSRNRIEAGGAIFMLELPLAGSSSIA